MRAITFPEPGTPQPGTFTQPGTRPPGTYQPGIPQPRTRPPGTLPPGTPQPGTCQPGTGPPGTYPESTLGGAIGATSEATAGQAASPDELTGMRRALWLAMVGEFRRGPNPRVGCVLLDADGRPLAEGWHRGAGHPHAEVAALTAAHREAAGLHQVHTAVVTLEPCGHRGRTGPCTEALLAAGVRRVVYAADDPNPAAAGGADRLRAAGIEVCSGLLVEEAEALNTTWTFAHRRRRPYVRWKTATTLDGYVAAHDRSSRWISSAAARRDAHRLRADVGAVLVGTGTVLADDPQLSARGADDRPLPRDRQPLRVVVGRRRPPAGARVWDDTAETIQVSDPEPSRVLTGLYDRGIHDVLLEGGPTLAAAFLRAGLVDEVVGYVAPVLLGRGVPAVGDLDIRSIDDACRLEVTAITVLEADPEPNIKIIARPRRRQEGR